MRTFVPRIAALIVGGLALTACSTMRYEFQQAAAGEPEARIPFVQYRTIRDWHADNDRQLFLQTTGRQWYQVDLVGPCIGLEYANGIRLDPKDPAGSFDRFSVVILKGQRCQVASVKKAPPPLRVEKARATRPQANQA